jgi:hypothetical protein
MIQLTVFDDRTKQPLVGAPVVFTDSTGSQVVMSNAAGQASATVTGATDVTVIQAYQNVRFVQSILGARPGDDLRLVHIAYDLTQGAPITVHFTPVAGTSFRACGPCGCKDAASGADVIAIPMDGYCQAPAVEITLVAKDSTGIRYATASDVAYTAASGGTATFSSSPTTPGLTYTALFTNIPADVDRIAFEYDGSGEVGTAYDPAGSTTVQVEAWRRGDARFFTTMSRGDYEYQLDVADIASSATSYELDVMTSALPWLGQPTFDEATRSLTITPTAGGPGDLVETIVDYRATDGALVEWLVFTDTPGIVALPEVPTTAADLTIQPGSAAAPSARMYAHDSIDGYAEAHLDPYALVDHLSPNSTGHYQFSGPVY